MKKTITIRADKELIEKVKRAAREDSNRSTNGMIVKMLEGWLKLMTPATGK